MARKAFPLTTAPAASDQGPAGTPSGDTAPMERARAGAPLGIDSLEPVRLDARSGSLDRLFRVQAPQLLRYVSRRIAVRDEADDLVQESFLRLARATAGQDFPARPEAYLQRIARNLLRNRAKRAIARAEHLHAPLDEETLSSREPGPDGLLEFRELAARYENALNALSPKTRNVFLRHRRDGYTYAEIAEELNQTVSNVEKHMMKAIAHLDRVLGRPE